MSPTLPKTLPTPDEIVGGTASVLPAPTTAQATEVGTCGRTAEAPAPSIGDKCGVQGSARLTATAIDSVGHSC